MLSRLIIQNYALIDSVEIDFSHQLNIITGETGAGKSIILGALSLILGQRQEQTSFFNPDKKCVVEGFFQIKEYQLQTFFEENDLEYEELTIIRREISPDGRSRAFVNDSPVNLTILKLLAESLISIHSQHSILELGKQSFQLNVLDSIALQQTEVKNFGKRHKKFLEKKHQLQQLIANAHNKKAELDYLQFQFQELNAAALKESELSQLEAELQTLTHAEDIVRTLQTVQYHFQEAENAQLSQLQSIIQQVQAIEKFHQPLEEIQLRLKSVYIELKDIVSEIDHIHRGISTDESRINKIQERLDILNSLLYKHKVQQTEELIALQKQFELEILAIENSDTSIEKLQVELQNESISLLKSAEELSRKRADVCRKIEESVVQTLEKLGMQKTIFNIKITPLDDFSGSGLDQVSFLFSANSGQVPAPISKIASGGELSRIMLCLKALIAQQTALPTLIFDEIDTGISGEVALQMGYILEELAQNIQIAAITHLPQIATRGNHHIFVYKENNDDTHTKTQLKILNPDERVHTIAEMLSGKETNEAAIANAKLLLNHT